jgi:hypothetical protein
MATNNCGTPNCGCTNSYVVTAPCPPACPEVFNAQCIVYTGTDIMCNDDTVIARYDYLDTVITKLVNYICSVEAPITVVVGSEYINVVSSVLANTTTYTVSVDLSALDAYFSIIIADTIAASILEGPGIDVSVDPITSEVTISHQDTSSVTNLTSNNTGNTFIQDIAFTFDTFGHVTAASVTTATVVLDVRKYVASALTGNQVITHSLATLDLVISVSQSIVPPANTFVHGIDYSYVLTNANQITVTELVPGVLGTYAVTVIG